MFKPTHALLIIQRHNSYLKPFLDEYLTSVVCEKNKACQNCDSCLEILRGTYSNFYQFDTETMFSRKDAFHLNEVFNRKQEDGVDKKIYLIKNLETLTASAMNSLLRLVENNPLNTYGIFTTKNENMILPTVLSRVQKIILKKARYVFEQIEKNDLLLLQKLFFTVDEQLTALENGSFERLKRIVDVMLIRHPKHQQVNEAWNFFKNLSWTEVAQLLNFMVDKMNNLTKKTRLMNILKNITLNPPRAVVFANLISW